MPATQEVKIVRHENSQALFAAMMGLAEADLPDGTMGYGVVGADGQAHENEEEVPLLEVLSQQEEHGVFGYADLETGEIHYWMDRLRVTWEELTAFFAHELSHLRLDERLPLADFEAEREARAEVIAGIAVEAARIAIDLKAMRDERIKRAYERYDSDPRVSGIDDFEAFADALRETFGTAVEGTAVRDDGEGGILAEVGRAAAAEIRPPILDEGGGR